MNSFGRLFRVVIYGESHGPAVGIIVDGCPAGTPLGDHDFTGDLARRMPDMPGTTTRKESPIPRIASGIFEGHATGAPILIEFTNTDTDNSAYDQFRRTPRPGHADLTAMQKFGGYNDYRGGGHFSGRLTSGLVAAGVIAKKIIAPVTVTSRLNEAGGDADVGSSVAKALHSEDSVGGIVECTVTGIPAGCGEPFFDSVESLISHAVFSIPAIKGIEFGSGFRAATMRGSSHNDAIVSMTGKTATNNAGGIAGGITNGNDLIFRVAVKPTATIGIPQQTIHIETGKKVTITATGRHDACIALRIPVILEAVTAIVLADLMLIEGFRGRMYMSPDRHDTLSGHILKGILTLPKEKLLGTEPLKELERATAKLEYLKHITRDNDSEELESFLHGLTKELNLQEVS